MDIDGVVVTSWEPIEGSVAALARLRAAGMPLRFVTNTTSLGAAEIVEMLRGIGVDLEAGDLINAGVATANLVRRDHPGARCLVLNDGSMADLTGISTVDPDDWRLADVVVIGSGGPSFTWEHLNAALRALQNGAALVAMHGSVIWSTASGVCLDAGAYAEMLGFAAGNQAVVVGKPAPELFVSACESMGVVPAEAVMVGDDLHSDVLAAQQVGITGVLVRTGKFRPAQLAGAPPPDHLVESLAGVPDLLGVA